MHPAPLRNAAPVLYGLVAGGLLIWSLSPANPTPTATAMFGIVLSIAASWLGSGGWPRKERWTMRLQASTIGFCILAVTHAAGEPEVAPAGLLAAVVATLFLWVCHLIPQMLRTLQSQLVTVAMFTRVEAARQILYFGSFSVPLALTFAPGPIGVGFVAVSGFAVGYLVTRRARRRLTNGLAREAA